MGGEDGDLGGPVGVIHIGVDAAPTQRIGEVARAVRGKDHERAGRRGDGAELGDGDLEIGEDFEQIGLEFLIRPVYLVDQKNRRLLLPDGFEQGALQQEFLREDPRLHA